ncbi:hypothetical protein [Paenibacillus agricola]|nr:hypothetical protein [Paenibacillus agricola]
MPRKKTEPKPKLNRKEWRSLPIADWNTLSFTEYFRDMNAERFGVTEYFPLRNWRFEQAQLKRALDAYGPALLHAAFDECFRDYKPTRDYPSLTAGFACSYRLNTIMPRLIADKAAQERRAEAAVNAADKAPSADAVMKWL